jgi:hypothetical protein
MPGVLDGEVRMGCTNGNYQLYTACEKVHRCIYRDTFDIQTIKSSIMAILDSVIHDFLKSCQCQLFSPNFTVPILQPLSDTLELEFQVQTKIQLSPHHIRTLANC